MPWQSCSNRNIGSPQLASPKCQTWECPHRKMSTQDFLCHSRRQAHHRALWWKPFLLCREMTEQWVMLLHSCLMDICVHRFVYKNCEQGLGLYFLSIITTVWNKKIKKVCWHGKLSNKQTLPTSSEHCTMKDGSKCQKAPNFNTFSVSDWLMDTCPCVSVTSHAEGVKANTQGVSKFKTAWLICCALVTKYESWGFGVRGLPESPVSCANCSGLPQQILRSLLEMTQLGALKKNGESSRLF